MDQVHNGPTSGLIIARPDYTTSQLSPAPLGFLASVLLGAPSGTPEDEQKADHRRSAHCRILPQGAAAPLRSERAADRSLATLPAAPEPTARHHRTRSARCLPAFVFLAAAMALGCAGGRPEEGPDGHEAIILITIDTLRADRLGCYGASWASTRTIDDLAREGILYEDATAPAPITLVSHATMLTGLNPPAHGVRNNGTFRLMARFTTLAERLKSAGFDTGAFVGAFVLHHEFGLDQGFDVYDDELPPRAAGRRFDFQERRAGEVLERAGDWALSRGGRPFFLWVHVFDPHAPYEPPAPFDERFAASPYDGEIAYVDFELGKFFGRLREAGLLSRSLVIVTSDHGEGLGDHGEETHGLLLYQSTLRVPLIVKTRQGPAGTRRIPETVGLVDLTPSILALAGLATSGRMDGRVLPGLHGAGAGQRSNPMTAGAAHAPAGYYLENLLPRVAFGWADLTGYRLGPKKVINVGAVEEGGAPIRRELYDLSLDPMEATDLIEGEPQLASTLLSRLRSEWQREVVEDAWSPELSAEARERLLALGYVAGAAVSDDAASQPPDPREMLGFFEDLQRAQGELRAGRTAQAASILQGLARGPAMSTTVLGLLGQARMELGEFEAAREAFESALQIDPRDYEARRRLAEAHYARGDYQAAVQQAREALRLNDRNAESQSILGAALARLGRHEEAIGHFRRAIADRPEEAALHYNLALALEQAGRVAEAEAAYIETIKQDPSSVPPRVALAQFDLARGDLGGARARLLDALRIAPDDLAALGALGVVLARAGDAEGALERFDRVVALDPGRAEGHFDRGVVLERLGRRVEAAEAFRRFLGLWRGDPRRAEAAREKLRSLGG